VIHLQAQNVGFNYDNDGNMIQRKILAVGSSSVKALHKDTASVSDVMGEQKITLYPNPTKGQFQVAIKILDSKQKNYFRLYSLSGAYLQEKNITSESTNIDISNYAKGAYLLDVFLGEKISRWKVIKQ
jgi:hypothetical protein